MTIKRTLVVIVLLSLLGLAASLWAYPRLPDQVPSHWNIAGEVDDTMQRDTIVYLLPGLGLVLGLLLLYIPYIDPLRANVERFRSTYNWFIVGMSLFFLFLHVLTILAGLGIRFNMTDMLIPAASAMVIGIGYVLERTKPNWFLGIRTPWTLSSSTVWDKTHRLGGLLFKLSGVTMLTGLLFSQEAAFFLLMGSILITTLVTIVYSYFAYRDEQMQAQNP
jgi:uncharacterized membrane protein